MVNSGHSRTELSFRKKAVYGFLVTCLFFLCVETLLAGLGVQSTLSDQDPFVGFESSIPLFVEESVDERTFMRTAENKLRFFNGQRFEKQKPENTYRVFCLGGSTTFGRPYDDRTSYVAWLREMLPLADSQRQWEVINAGGISYASYRLAAMMDELVQYSPDLFLIYTGHNEFLEERTYGDLSESSPSLQRATAALLRSRTGSLAYSIFGQTAQFGVGGSTLSAEVDTILDHSVGPDSYHRNEPLRGKVLEHFEFNLARMVQTARDNGAKVIFVKPASNQKDFSPFKSEHRRDLSDVERQRWASLFESAKELESQGKTDQALAHLYAANEIDDGRADLDFQIGTLLLRQEKHAEAGMHFRRAIDNDICSLRAITGLRRLVEQTAVVHHVPLVDFDSILRFDCLERFGHEIPGREYFLDHVHPTVESHRLLALAVVEAMTLTGVVSPDPQWGDEAVALATRRIEATMDLDLQTRALTNLAQVLGWAGKKEEAGALANEAVRRRAEASLQDDPESMLYAAVDHAVNGRDAEAIGLFRRVVELEPDNVEARWRLAALLYDQQQFEQSRAEFYEAIRLDPSDAYSFQMLGAALTELGQYDEALEVLQRAADLDPGNAAVESNIESLQRTLQRD